MKKKVLIVNPHYYPGYKMGGPQQTVKNICDAYADLADVHLVTLNHDFGEKEPYAGIRTGEWLDRSGIKIMYVEAEKYGYKLFSKLYKEFPCIYCCGFFSEGTRDMMLVHSLHRSCREFYVAPMGVFSANAFNNKRIKKKIYVTLAKMFGITRNTIWSFTSERERKDTQKILGNRTIKKFIIAEDLPRKESFEHYRAISKSRKKEGGVLNVIFLSRIVPQKNLLQVIEILNDKYAGSITLDIYGPSEDKDYWEVCKRAIDKLPANINVEYKGSIRPEQSVDLFSQYDIFLFPTKGENYGHVIHEALSAGCVPVISDQTPWSHFHENKCGEIIKLEDIKSFRGSIRAFLEMSDEFNEYRLNAIDHAERKYIEAISNSGYDNVFL